MAIILASASPRRKELMYNLVDDFEIVVSNVDESLPGDIPPEETVRILAARKANEVAAKHPGDVVIGSDTVVAIDGEILGKPVDKADAERMLKLLSGRTHEVFTGLCVVSSGESRVMCNGAKVTFSEVPSDEIARYIESGEYRDKAGGYAIQGFAARFIESIEGDFYSVVGLPVNMLYRTLKEIGAV